MGRTTGFMVFFVAASAAAPVLAQNAAKTTDVEIVGHVYEPAKLEPTDERVQSLQVPDGFRIETFAEGLGNPRMIAVAEDGAVYVTRREEGDCLMLRDTNGDG
jgi:glucose/arabinose dehydrogenase